MGFPFQECDGYASPLRMDLHFPSCFNPAAGLTNYKQNMQFPTDAGNGKQDCPSGWIHTLTSSSRCTGTPLVQGPMDKRWQVPALHPLQR